MKKFLLKISERYQAIKNCKYVNKYTITLAVFIVWLMFFDNNSIVKRFKVWKEQRIVNQQIAEYNETIEKNQRLIDALGSNTENLEKFAREHYRMKRPNEEVFIIKE